MERIYKLLAVATLLIATPSWAQSVIRDGNEWLQPADFVNLSWDTVNIACPPPGNLCAGSLNSTDVTGYTWASQAEIDALLAGYGVPPATATEFGSTWAPAVLADFRPSNADPTVEQITVFFSDLPGAPNTVGVESISNSVLPAEQDIHFHQTGPADLASSFVGHWFYRAATPTIPTTPATSVPTISAYGLVLTVLGLIIVATRRLSRRKVNEG
jgi:hypothetical protein